MWLDAKFLSIRGRLSCYQQSRPFELWIPGEALPTLIKRPSAVALALLLPLARTPRVLGMDTTNRKTSSKRATSNIVNIHGLILNSGAANSVVVSIALCLRVWNQTTPSSLLNKRQSSNQELPPPLSILPPIHVTYARTRFSMEISV